ncbi:hypothetical protein [Embleya scabrispora]|uniref:hypothetical protein n=1 Tax=Embleya scabrispora TaxID=159449 RepID=UPI0003AA73FD|nr:hypothetical protein [Embleya scabrispora]MYS83710.1 hypothetical protein [Streptomyces sp. SID5474]
MFTMTAEPDGGFNDDFASWQTPNGTWWADNTGAAVAGDVDGDGREDVAIMYNYADGATRAMTFKSRPDGGTDGEFRSWGAPPGTW